jgi:hypothetical protein
MAGVIATAGKAGTLVKFEERKTGLRMGPGFFLCD